MSFRGQRASAACLADHIHISAATNHFLVNIIGDYETESRGETLIKVCERARGCISSEQRLFAGQR